MVRVRQRKSLGFTEFRTGVRVAAYYVYTPPQPRRSAAKAGGRVDLSAIVLLTTAEASAEDGPPVD